VSPRWPRELEPDRIDCSLSDDNRRDISPPQASPGDNGPGAGRGFGPGRRRGPVVFTKVPRFFTARTGDTAWRLGVMGNDQLRLVVGLNFDQVTADLQRMGKVFLVTLPVALLLVGGGGWLVAGRALRPLRTIAQLAEHVTARGLDQRIPLSREDPEITRLIRVLNGMMDRLEASFRQATRFSADASHELKTPLAIMQGELENALQAAAPGSSEQQVFSNLLEETQRLKTITRSLLLLAQADAGQLKLALEQVDLSALLESLIEDARILAARLNLRFDLNLQPGIQVQADGALLQMALLNLLRNAVEYIEPGGSVGVTLAARNERVELSLCNTGPGIPAAEQGQVFDRFYRADRTRQDGTDGLGLGLSLAREIIHAHHGTLVLQESRPGRTCFSLTLNRLRH
jgi:two-component system heavy metal sensor histidine kinase CusS